MAGILNHLDRCEVRGCNARAYVRGLFNALREEQKTAAVDMCAHHARVNAEAIAAQAYTVIDEFEGCNCGRCGS